MAEYADCYLTSFPLIERTITMRCQDVLNSLSVGDNRGFVMLTTPQINVIVGRRLNLITALKNPLMFGIFTIEYVSQ